MTDSLETPNLENAFAALAEVGAELNKGTDSLNHILRSVQKRLDQLNLHVEAEIKLPHSPAEPNESYFGYGQAILNQTAGWGLYLRVDGEKYAKSIFDCSRDARILAVGHLPKLLKTIEARAKKILADIEEAKAAYQSA